MIRIGSWREENAACLRIMDVGVGIPSGDLDHIFDKFYRVEKGDRVRPGTGLGLAICKEFIEAQGGKIWVESGIGSGSRFGFSFPIAL